MQHYLKILGVHCIVGLGLFYSSVLCCQNNINVSSHRKNAKPVYLTDDFEHGTLDGWSNLADWENSEESPISGDFSLKHVTGSDTSHIFHPLYIADFNADTFTWRVKLRNGNWDPSGSNKFWFFLAGDRANLSSGANGYAVGVNFTGTDDLLKLWRITNGLVSATLISSSLDWNPNTLAGMEVTRFPGGTWELKLDRQGDFNNLVSEGTGNDNTHQSSLACGLVFIYTRTRAGLLWMDDLYIGPPVADTILPEITSAKVLTGSTISLHFSENPDPLSALDLTNYLVNGSISPVSAEFMAGNKHTVMLRFAESFSEQVPFELSVTGISDLAGNTMLPFSIILFYESFKAVGLRITAGNRIKISFNREVNISSAETTSNYFITPGNINPIAASVNTLALNEVFIEFAEPFIQKISYSLNLENIKDKFEDKMNPTVLEFVYYIAMPYDVVINEIMARPEPSFGLPGKEYLELFNKSGYVIDLTGWYLRIGTSSRSLPEYQMQPGSYLVLCHPNHVSAFSQYGETLGIQSFPAISDAGQTISLLDKQDNVISAVAYKEKWYGSSFKASGGWSLEQIDPENPCAGASNWSASTHPSGGTPGRINSILNLRPDTDPILVNRVVPVSSNLLRVFFTESYHYQSITSADLFSVNMGIGNPVQVIINPPLFTFVDLVFATPFISDVTYELFVERSIYDCAGNLLGTRNKAKFAIPKQPSFFDLVVNEILFNPHEGGVDFVEVYNRSQKVINLREVIVASRDAKTGELRSLNQSSPEGFLVFPGEYAVITTSTPATLNHYYTPNPYGFSEISTLPAFNNDQGVVVILNTGMEILDEFSYTESMHYPLLTGAKGVSLERINFDRETNDPQNWHSASQTVGFATPAYKNSQFVDGLQESQRQITIEPEVFSPDNDGFDDVVNIHYEFEKPGFVANIIIYDSRGRTVKKLVQNQILGTSGFFSWVGTNDARQMSPLGIYLIYIDLFHADGTRKQFKKTCVLAGKLY